MMPDSYSLPGGSHLRGALDCGGELGYDHVVAKTVILSEETVRSLIEAHASLAAWYYQMSEALRQAGAGVEPPTDEQRKAFVAQMGQHFPELAGATAEVTAPRPYVPPPVVPAPAKVVENEGVTVPEPPKDYQATPPPVAGAGGGDKTEPADDTPAAVGLPPGEAPAPEAPASSEDVPAPPPMVDPSKVKYE
jgi:hypothetical protein